MPGSKINLHRDDGSMVEYVTQQTAVEIRDDGIAVVFFDSEKTLHSFTKILRAEMLFILEDLKHRENVKVIIWTGRGERAFSSGAALGGKNPEVDVEEEILEEYKRRGSYPNFHTDSVLTRETLAFWNYPKPVIGAINAQAIGGAANIALLYFDMCICSERAKFRYPFVEIGLTPELGSSLVLPLIVGFARAKEVVLTGDFFDGHKAKEWGLVNDVVPHEELMPKALELARKLAKQPSHQLMLAKQLLNHQVVEKLESTLLLENQVIFSSLNDFGGKQRMLEKMMSMQNKKKAKL